MQITAEAVCLSPKRDHGEIVLVDTNGHGALTLRGSDDEIHELLSLIADLLYENGAEVSKRDPGEREDVESGNVWPEPTAHIYEYSTLVRTDPIHGVIHHERRPVALDDLLEQSIKNQVREGGRKLGAS